MRGYHARWVITSVTVGMVGAVPAPRAIQPASIHAFVDVTLIPMDSARVQEHQTVVVANGLVTSAGPVGVVRVPAGATAIDGRGKYLMPGLGDAHAHLSTQGGDTALAQRALTLYLLKGVTMVRSMYTESHHATVAARIARGELRGPRVVLVSPALHGGNARTPDAARDSVRTYAAAGYQQIKVLPGLSRVVFEAIAEEARRLSVPLVGHIPAAVGLDGALAGGFASIEHLDGFVEAMQRGGQSTGPSGFFGFDMLDGIDDTRASGVIARTRTAGVTVVPTLVSMEVYANADSAASMARRESMPYVPAALRERWAREKDGFNRGNGVTANKATRFREVRRRLVRDLHAAGVPIALGSDGFSLFNVPGFSTMDELEVLVAAGLAPFSALEAATVGVARLLQLPGVTGKIAVGASADLLLLDGNPLESISNVRRQAGVMSRGTWLSREVIAAHLQQMRP